ncbi:MAG: hypothetical protein IK015_08845 [Treponema sp.]|nr:hypothetical protein [Treponema sp.]
MISSWHPYYDDIKPYRDIKTKAEEELDKIYGSGYYDFGPEPFPFHAFESEDDYGSDSWP